MIAEDKIHKKMKFKNSQLVKLISACVCRTRASFKQFCQFAANTDYAGTIRLCEIIKVQLLSCGRSVQKLIKRKVTQDRHTIIMKTRIPLKLMFQHWDVLPLFSH